MSTFALAFGSKHKVVVQNCKELMLKYLNVIFDQTNQVNISPEKEQDHIQTILKELFANVNQ